MPELPEIHSAAKLVNQVSSSRFFRNITKSEVSKCKPFDWNSTKFRIEASARGKEMQMILKDSSEGAQILADLKLTFNFGMSGRFSFDRFDQIPKHAHLQFCTLDNPPFVLSFVDYRRFGKWEVRDFDMTRGPDPVTDYPNFRQKILANLAKPVFTKAICEVIMEQEYFNGIGNYLRAEILYRAKVPPFTKAGTVLESLPAEHEIDPEHPDILDLCSLIPKEVFSFTKPGEGYRPDPDLEQFAPFRNWLQCYMKPGMQNLVDHQNRTVWFSGPAGPMVPSKSTSRHNKKTSRVKSMADSTLSIVEKKEEDSEDGPSSSGKLKPKPEVQTLASRGRKRDLFREDLSGSKSGIKLSINQIKRMQRDSHSIDDATDQSGSCGRASSKPVKAASQSSNGKLKVEKESLLKKPGKKIQKSTSPNVGLRRSLRLQKSPTT